MIRGVAQETRAAMRFLTTRHYTAPGVESLQARQWTGWATDRGHPAFAIASTTTTRSIFPIGRGVKNRGVGFQAAKAVENSVLGFGPRPRLLYRVGRKERIARGRKGEPMQSLQAYILKTYPDAVLIAANAPGIEGVQIDEAGTFQGIATPPPVRPDPPPRRRTPPATPQAPREAFRPHAWQPGMVRHLEGLEAVQHVQAIPAQPQLHWKPPTPEPRRVQVPQQWRPRLWSDPVQVWTWVKGEEFQFAD